MFLRLRKKQAVEPPAVAPAPAAFDTSALHDRLIRLGEDALAEEVRINPHNVIPICRFGEKLRLADPREYRSFVADVNLRMFSPLRHEYLHDLSAFERETYFEVATKCAQMPESIASTIRFVEYIVQHDIAGDFVECGVFLGATPYVIGKTLKHLGSTDRRIFLYDTFEGIPSPDPIDIMYKPDTDYSALSSSRLAKDAPSDWMRSPLETTRANVELSGYPIDKHVYVKGFVEDTIPAQCPEKIALLRLDTDLYRSTKHELEHLYPRLTRGGLLILDDYGCYLGAKLAADEYFSEHRIPKCLFRIDEHVRAFIKQ